MLTTADLDQMATDDNWLGFGYVGERERQKQSTDEPGALDALAVADQQALAAANRQGMTYERLFAWANSKQGRWYGDCMLGSNGLHAERFLP